MGPGPNARIVSAPTDGPGVKPMVLRKKRKVMLLPTVEANKFFSVKLVLLGEVRPIVPIGHVIVASEPPTHVTFTKTKPLQN